MRGRVGRPVSAYLLPLPFVAWAIYCLARGELRWELVALLVVAPALALWSDKSRRFLVLLYPIGLVGLLYDSMRFFRLAFVTPSRVHACDLQAAERALFGVGAAHETPNDFWQHHASPILDAICAVPYGIFLFAIVGFAIWLYFKDERAMRRFTWVYLALNVAGFATYHVFPAAPPWYVAQHGCAIDLYAHASEGPNLARVDHWLGFGYFHGLYGRSNDVFGAFPSLHVAYPVLILLAGWKIHGGVARTLMVLFFVTMAFASVYLEHHWVIDGLCGIVYAVVAYAIVGAVVDAIAARERAGARERAIDGTIEEPA